MSTQVVIYTRVSTAEQALGFSIAAQAALVREYCTKQGFQIAAEFSDDESARTGGTRTEFRAMIDYIAAHPECRVIVVEKLDRAYRNLKDYLLLDDLDVELHLVKDNEVMSKKSGSSQRLMHGIRVLFARSVSENIAEEAAKGMRQKAIEGGWPSYAPLFYRNVDEGCGIALDATAGIGRELFARAAEGVSLRTLVRFARESGLTGKRGGPLAKATIAKVLENPLYWGRFRWKGVEYDGKFEPLIARSLFDAVQDALTGRSKPKARKNSFLYAGLLRCAACNGLLTGDRKEKGTRSYVYYSCAGTRGCRAFYRQEVFEDQTVAILRSLRIDHAVSTWIAEELDAWQDQAKAGDRREAARLGARIEELRRKISQAYDDRLTGAIDEAFWRERSGEWRAEVDDLTRRKAALEVTTDQASFRAAVTAPLELLETAADQYVAQNEDQKRRMLRILFSNFSITAGTITAEMRSPFHILAKGAETNDWRPLLDDYRQACCLQIGGRAA